MCLPPVDDDRRADEPTGRGGGRHVAGRGDGGVDHVRADTPEGERELRAERPPSGAAGDATVDDTVPAERPVGAVPPPRAEPVNLVAVVG